MKLWIAREGDGYLWLFSQKPTRHGLEWFLFPNRHGGVKMDSISFPSVTFENSPQQVELKLCNTDFDRILEENKDVLKRMKESDN